MSEQMNSVLYRETYPSSVKPQLPLKDVDKMSKTIVSNWRQAERCVVARKAYRTSCFYHLSLAEVEAIKEYRLRV